MGSCVTRNSVNAPRCQAGKCQRHSVQASERRPWRTTCSISPRERPISWSMRRRATATSRDRAARAPRGQSLPPIQRMRSSTVRGTRSMPRASEAERACTRATMLSSIAAERASDEISERGNVPSRISERVLVVRHQTLPKWSFTRFLRPRKPVALLFHLVWWMKVWRRTCHAPLWQLPHVLERVRAAGGCS